MQQLTPLENDHTKMQLKYVTVKREIRLFRESPERMSAIYLHAKDT